MMALTRGANALYPCPICLVPKKEIINLSATHPLRTTATMRQAWLNSREIETAAGRDEALQQYGLRDVDVSVLDFERQAICTNSF